MIIGPNGVGKTKLAYELARRNNGAIINLDRTYLYKRFPITTGLQDTLSEQGVPRHLYELLEPDEASYSAEDFTALVDQSSGAIQASGCLAVAEGGSTLYVPHLLKLNAQSKRFKHIIGLRFPQQYDVASKYRQRIDQAFEEGLPEELAANLQIYRNSFLIKECHFAVPTVRYLDGHLSLRDAKEEVLQRCLDYKDRQLKLFEGYPEIRWVDVAEYSEFYQELASVLLEQ